jgi:uncharacterized protein with PhoU and TrkA domain
MSTPRRIYRINDGRTARLVRATSQAQAIRHVASSFDVRVATQDDIADLVSSGVRVEDPNINPVSQRDEE